MAIVEIFQASLSAILQRESIYVLFVSLIIAYQFIKNHRLPPGPYGLPFVGYGPFLSKARAKDIAGLCEKYKTDILSINIYGRLYVFINTFELTKEAFQKRTDLVDRLDDASFSRLDPGYGGIIGSSGQFWKEHRRFAISMLRDFGMGRIAAEKMIQDENKHLMAIFRTYEGRTFDPKGDINRAVSNVICSITFGKRFDYKDEMFNHALESMNRIMGPASSMDPITLFSKMLMDYIPTFVNKLLFGKIIQIITESYEGFSSFSKLGVEEHKKTYDGTVNDLIDGYFKEIERREHDDESFFNECRGTFSKRAIISDDDGTIFLPERQASCLVTDLFLAGSETTFTSLRWTLLYMAAYPAIQERVHKELAELVGPHRMPEMSDKKSTPYTEAVLSEVQRFNTLVQFGVLHSNLNDDVEINGYIVPKQTPVGANFYQIHRDPATWKNPNQFDPENFLKDGKVVNIDKLLQFSIGRRACAGEALARMELYIFFASWMKDFKIEFDTENTIPDLKGYYGGVFMPTKFEIKLSERFMGRIENEQ